jgi:hypothetical protein
MRSLTAATIIMLSFTGAAIAQDSLYTPPKEIFVDSLIVNTDPNIITKTKKTEAEGVKDYRRLVQTSTMEEAHVYLPEDTLWVEIMDEHTLHYDKGIIDEIGGLIRKEYLYELMKNHNKMNFYHFHPTERLDGVNIIIDNLGDKTPPAILLALKNQYAALSNTPSEDDLALLIKQTLKYQQINPEGEMVHKVCATLGTLSYYVTNKGMEHFKDLLNEEVMGTKIDIDSIAKLYGREIREKHSAKRLIPATLENPLGLNTTIRIEKILEDLKNPYISFEFKPY